MLKKLLAYLGVSKFMKLSVALTAFGIVQANLPMLRESLQQYYPYVFIGVGIIVAVLRQVTTQSLDDKVAQRQAQKAGP